jgi:hypothetical protein
MAVNSWNGILVPFCAHPSGSRYDLGKNLREHLREIAIFFTNFPLINLGNAISDLRTKTIEVTDNRVRLMNDVLSAIKLVKLYCWEMSFHKKVKEVG